MGKRKRPSKSVPEEQGNPEEVVSEEQLEPGYRFSDEKPNKRVSWFEHAAL